MTQPFDEFETLDDCPLSDANEPQQSAKLKRRRQMIEELIEARRLRQELEEFE